MMLTDPMGDNGLRETVGTALLGLVSFGVGANLLNLFTNVITVIWHKCRLNRLKQQALERKEESEKKKVEEIKVK